MNKFSKSAADMRALLRAAASEEMQVFWSLAAAAYDQTVVELVAVATA